MSPRTPLFAAGGALLVAVLAYFVLVLPKMGQVSETREQLQAAQQEEAQLRSQLSRLEAARVDAPRIRRELAELRRRVPKVADLPGILNLLQDAADQAKVDFFSVSPGDPEAAPVGGAAAIPAEVQVIGSFFQVDEFLFRLESLSRATRVGSVDVSAGPDGLPQISVGLSLSFFTTDVDAGPGAPAETPSPEASPSPSPGAAPTVGPSPGG